VGSGSFRTPRAPEKQDFPLKTTSSTSNVALLEKTQPLTLSAQTLTLADTLDNISYRIIGLGFPLLTVGIISGGVWANEAWGSYWSWDPKETWALIVWLNYAAWLHMRLMKGLRGTVAAWWALAGLAITTFAFIGVNMFLSGLHSYGTL
jgi:cytochrome c-type biogenesis protein CcsB